MPRPKKPRVACQQCGQPVKRASYIYCSNRCQKEFEYRTYIDRWKAGLESGNIRSGNDTISRHVRRYLLETRGERCEECGWAEKNPVTLLVPVTIEHVDGDATNTTEPNLKVLCPNCHSLTPTYGSLNKGNGRKSRYNTRV